MYSVLCQERDLLLPTSYNNIEEPFVMKIDGHFLEVVGTQLVHIFYLKFVPQRVNST
jgi:hypothetical protein